MTMSASLPRQRFTNSRSAPQGLPGFRADNKPTTDQAAPRIATTGWYHEAAIEEAKRGSEH